MSDDNALHGWHVQCQWAHSYIYVEVYVGEIDADSAKEARNVATQALNAPQGVPEASSRDLRGQWRVIGEPVRVDIPMKEGL